MPPAFGLPGGGRNTEQAQTIEAGHGEIKSPLWNVLGSDYPPTLRKRLARRLDR